MIPTVYGFATTAVQVTEGLDLSGKTFVITGVNSGIGRESARVIALRGAHVIGLARGVEAAEATLSELGVVGSAVACELSEPESVRQAVSEIKGLGRPLHGILCNAGIMALPSLTLKHGHELQFWVNHVGHFILVTGLLERLSLAGRVVMTSSEAYTMAPKCGVDFDTLGEHAGYKQWAAYGQSKLANILFAKELSRRFEGSERTANALHPGVIRTNLQRHLPNAEALMARLKDSTKTIAQGAATQVYLATHPSLSAQSGGYYSDCRRVDLRGPAEDAELARRLWDYTEGLLAVG